MAHYKRVSCIVSAWTFEVPRSFVRSRRSCKCHSLFRIHSSFCFSCICVPHNKLGCSLISKTHSCPNFIGGLAKQPLKLWHGWVFTSHVKLWIYLLIHVPAKRQPNEYDVCVVGAGTFGSAAARHLTNLHPEKRVLLIGPSEKKVIGCLLKLYPNLFLLTSLFHQKAPRLHFGMTMKLLL